MVEGEKLPAVERLISQARIDQYAEASGDYNPVHVDRDYAAASQFGSTIAHGMMVAATISEMMTASFGADWAERGRLKLRFRAPVLSGDTVTAFGEVKRVGEWDAGREIVCSVAVRRQTGEVAVAGEAVVVVLAQP